MQIAGGTEKVGWRLYIFCVRSSCRKPVTFGWYNLVIDRLEFQGGEWADGERLSALCPARRDFRRGLT